MSPGQHTTPLRLLLGGVILAWLWKFDLFAAAIAFAVAHPLVDPFFPGVFRSPWLLGAGLLLPPAVAIPALVRPSFVRLGLAFAASALGALLLMLHQATYNDASFLTAFWSSLFGLWLLAREDCEPSSPERESLYARFVVALLFLGGFVGKLTPGYWDGSVLFALYFVEREHWPFRLARWLFDGEQLRSAATVYSRFVVCSEGLLATLPLWPARYALGVACAVLTGMVLLNNYLLLSVLGPLLGVCAAGLHCDARAATRARKIRAASAYSRRSDSVDASLS